MSKNMILSDNTATVFFLTSFYSTFLQITILGAYIHFIKENQDTNVLSNVSKIPDA